MQQIVYYYGKYNRLKPGIVSSVDVMDSGYTHIYNRDLTTEELIELDTPARVAAGLIVTYQWDYGDGVVRLTWSEI